MHMCAKQGSVMHQSMLTIQRITKEGLFLRKKGYSQASPQSSQLEPRGRGPGCILHAPPHTRIGSAVISPAQGLQGMI